jgi:hypothetical protein
VKHTAEYETRDAHGSWVDSVTRPLNENGITVDLPRTVTVIEPRTLLPLAVSGVLNAHEPRPPATLPVAATFESPVGSLKPESLSRSRQRLR